MYEPYEEKKTSKVKEFFQRLVSRIQKPKYAFTSKFGDRKLSVLLLILAVIAIGGGLSYTGYTAYTSAVSEAQSQVEIQDRQINALNEEMNGYKTNLAVCNTDLKNKNDMVTKAETDLKATQNRLTACTADLTNQINTSAVVQTSFTALQVNHTTLQTNYKTLECKYAEDKGCDYYTLSNSKIQCCGRIDDKFYCGTQFVPTEASNVKKVSEYCQS